MILAIETSHTPGSVAMAPPPGATGPSAESEFPPGLVHGRELLPRIARLLESASLPRTALTHVAVSAGPGSYTGVRIGVSAAKSLAWALRLPALAVSTLEVIAQNVDSDLVEEGGEFAIILDARRGHCYGARFRRDPQGITRLSADSCVAPAEFLASLAPATPLVGEGTRLPGAENFPHGPEAWNTPRASAVARIATRIVQGIETGDLSAPPEYHDAHQLVPTYLRASEAEERAGRRVSQGESKGNRDAPASGMG